jgi:hypothetical protein
MKQLPWAAVGLLAAFAGIGFAAEELKSGPQPGDTAGAFNVKDITGPQKGKSLCYR